jgi:hypothetical protein
MQPLWLRKVLMNPHKNREIPLNMKENRKQVNLPKTIGAGMAQLVQRLAKGWTAERSRISFFKLSTHPPVQCVPGAFSSGVKRPGLEDDHSPRTSAEVNKQWIDTFTPLTST